MKKKISRIWGVGLVLVLAVSLLLSAAPVSASTLAWGTEGLPGSTGEVIEAGDVTDIDVSGDGVIWAGGGGLLIYKSTDSGVSWTTVTTDNNTNLVAVAPDDSDIVAIADTTSNLVWVTTNGGTTWGSLSTIIETGGTAVNTIKDIAISPESSGTHYVAVAGHDGTTGNVWYFNIGAAAPVWKDTEDLTGFQADDRCGAVSFSPNFASDQVMVAVTVDTTTGDATYQMFSMNLQKWNSNAGFGSGYPLTIVAASATGVDMASIALAPDFLGSDDATRVSFIGLDLTGDATNSGIYRLKDTGTPKAMSTGEEIYSVDYDGTNLVAGRSADTRVRRSDDPLVTSPTVSSSSSIKSAGGNASAIVAWVGADVVCGTSGDESAFAVSTDNGKTFNDISLIDTALTNIEDVAVSADGEVLYAVTNDGTTTATITENDLSVWRKASSWQRVLSLAINDGTTVKKSYIVRLAPDDSDAVYVSEIGAGAATIYYSNTGGDTKWFTRSFRYSTDGISDLAVEGDGDTAYVGINGKATVSKTTNSGFTWKSAKSTKLAGGTVATIKSLGEDLVIVGSTSGYVAYSTDGYETWEKISKGIGNGAVQMDASGLADGDFIYASSAAAADYIYRWELGESTSWKKISDQIGAGFKVYGLGLSDGALYAVSANGTTGSATTSNVLYRTLGPTASTVSWSTVSGSADFTATPQGLKISSGSTKLWAIDADAAASEETGDSDADDELYSFSDTLSAAGPALASPGHGAEVMMNPVSGKSYDVSFTWERPSKATEYELQIALDYDFAERVKKIDNIDSTSSTVSYIVGPGGTTTLEYMPETTYYWKVRASSDGPIYSPWSATRMFSVGALPEVQPPVEVVIPPTPPAPEIVVETPAPTPVPEIVVETPPPPPDVVIPPAPAPPAPITPAYIWAIIIIGAILVIAVIVLIVRTRRPV
jgi:hypothetical protein